MSMKIQFEGVRKIYNTLICLYSLHIVVDASNVPCEPGWTVSLESASCLQLFRQPLSWYEARLSCKDHGGDLVQILGSKMNEFITDLVLKNQQDVYIGLNSHNKKKKWLDNKEEEGYVRPGTLDIEGFKCGLLLGNHTKGTWDFVECQTKNHYMCEKGPDLCPPDWLFSAPSGTCIRAYKNSRLSWKHARAKCKEDGGDLVVIYDKAMNDFVIDQFAMEKRNLVFYIGLKKKNARSKWKWLDNPEEVNYTNWEPGQPAEVYKLCVGFAQKSAWGATDCIIPRQFVCETFSDSENEKYGTISKVNCSLTHCFNKQCNERNGNCYDGCEEGYTDPKCDFALSRCSTFCINQTCNERTGECLEGCVTGFVGLKCDAYREKDFSFDFSMVFATGSIGVALIFPFILCFGFVLDLGRTGDDQSEEGWEESDSEEIQQPKKVEKVEQVTEITHSPNQSYSEPEF